MRDAGRQSGTHLSCKKIPNNLSTYLPSSEWNIIPHFMIHSDFLSKNTALKGEDNFTVEKVDKCYLSILGKDNMNSDVMLILCTLAMM